jgi:hypothetical protein
MAQSLLARSQGGRHATPRPGGAETGLHWLGRQRDMQIWMYVFDTSFNPLELQERILGDSIRDLALKANR